MELIHDAIVQRLEWKPVSGLSTLPVLSFEDHLLRRFGLVEILAMKQGQDVEYPPRHHADEVWIMISGDMTFELEDLREDSPTFKVVQVGRYRQPVRVLIPFGVKNSIHAKGASTVVRLATHGRAVAKFEPRSVDQERP